MNNQSKNGNDIFARIRTLRKLTPSQVKIVDWFHLNQNSLAFENLTALSRKAGVSKASMDRFLIHVLGYRDFAEFQAERQKKMENRLDSPITRYLRASGDGQNRDDVLNQHLSFSVQAVQYAQKCLNADVFHKITTILTQTKRPLHIMGHRTSFSLAFMLYINLQYVRPLVSLLGDAHSSLPVELFNVAPDDAVLIISRRRYSQNSLQISQEIKKIGAEIILVTDSEIAPVAHLADTLLVIPPPLSPVFESMTAWTAILEAMILAVAEECQRKEPKHAAMVERLLSDFYGIRKHMGKNNSTK